MGASFRGGWYSTAERGVDRSWGIGEGFLIESQLLYESGAVSVRMLKSFRLRLRR
jgi:hypothetical protein